MPESTFTIDDTFFIQGRGLVLLSHFDRDAAVPVRVRVGDELDIATISDRFIRTTVTGVEMIHAPPMEKLPLGILVALSRQHDADLKGATAKVVKGMESESRGHGLLWARIADFESP